MKESKLAKSQLEKYRQILLETQRNLANHINSMKKSVLQNSSRDASGDITNLPTHIADMSADTVSQNLTIGLLENDGKVMKNIADALKRIDENVYGICEDCQKAIPIARLDYIPYAKKCVTCKSKEEKKRKRMR